MTNFNADPLSPDSILPASQDEIDALCIAAQSIRTATEGSVARSRLPKVIDTPGPTHFAAFSEGDITGCVQLFGGHNKTLFDVRIDTIRHLPPQESSEDNRRLMSETIYFFEASARSDTFQLVSIHDDFKVYDRGKATTLARPDFSGSPEQEKLRRTERRKQVRELEAVRNLQAFTVWQCAELTKMIGTFHS